MTNPSTSTINLIANPINPVNDIVENIIEVPRLINTTAALTLNVPTGDNNIDGLLFPQRWASNVFTGKTSLTFSFPNTFDDYGSNYPNSDIHEKSFESLNNTQQAVAKEWFDMYEDISNLDFTQLFGSSDRNAVIRMAESDHPPTAYAFAPLPISLGGDIWFDRDEDRDINKRRFNSPQIGNYAYHTFGHEIGHALGLKHGHETSSDAFLEEMGLGGAIDIPDVPGLNVQTDYNRDSMEFSIMTYRSYIGGPDTGYGNERWGYAQFLMMYDIAAIQHMYGANFDTNSGNTTYSFSTTTGEMFVDGVRQGTPGGNRIFRTIWDGSGIDTYDFDNYTTNLSVDLRPGKWSDLDVGGNSQRAKLDNGNNIYARAHVFNALQFGGDNRSLIENAKGGSGNDRIYGNEVANSLIGNDGADRLFGYSGKDFLKGGSGKDYLYGGRDNDILKGDSEDDYLSGSYGNDELQGGDNNDRLYGGSDNDTLYGGRDNDRLYGGSGNDKVYGDSGHDYLKGDGGNDSLTGGSGNDILMGTHYNLQGNGEVDTLTSGSMGDRDTFVLGEKGRVYYNDKSIFDKAIITDFDTYSYSGETSYDRIQIVGSTSQYSIQYNWFTGDTSIALGSDEIAVVQGVDLTRNMSRHFVSV